MKQGLADVDKTLYTLALNPGLKHQAGGVRAVYRLPITFLRRQVLWLAKSSR